MGLVGRSDVSLLEFAPRVVRFALPPGLGFYPLVRVILLPAPDLPLRPVGPETPVRWRRHDTLDRVLRERSQNVDDVPMED